MHVALIGAEVEESLAVRYLWGALEQSGHQVTQIVFNDASEVEAATRQLAQSGAALAGMSMVFTWRAREFAELATRARQLGYDGHLVAGGHFAAFHADQLLADVPAIDSVALGEGEELMVELATSLDDLGRVAGLVWRSDQQVMRNPPATKPPDLDRLAEPKRMEPYDEFLGLPITNMLASRGCEHSCVFCSIAAWHRLCGGERLRLRSPARVAEEMATQFHRGVRLFNFHDDNFILDDPEQMKDRLGRLSEELERRGVGQIGLAAKSRPDTVDEEVFTILKRMGLFRVFLGIEAGTQSSLARLGRRQTLADNERALEIVNRLDLHACFNLLVLNPDSTLEDLAGNVAFLRDHPQNPMNFCRTEVYAGTPLQRQLQARGRLEGSYWGHDYRIADPRAQAAFEVIFDCFETRNFGEHSLHHRAMHVDYELQLLSDFYDRDDELRGRVKQFIVAVNHNTCEHLEAIIAALGSWDGDPASQDGLVRLMRVRVHDDNRSLMERGDALLAEIRACAAEPRAATAGWARTVTAAGLAAALTVSTTACDKPGDVPHPEMAPPPTAPPRVPDAGSQGDDGRFATPPDPTSPLPPLGPAELVRSQLEAQELPFIASRVPVGQPLEIELWVGADGKLEKVLLTRAQLAPAPEAAIQSRLAQWPVSAPAAASHRFVLVYSPEQLATARAKWRPVPRPEMAPPPPPRPEMAPPPPRPEMAPRPLPPKPKPK
ncbi:MAG: B12-binding domain-containing radical SAM protein [Deltaproteobacteria bacterium]|nr:B12-binding domain-containing radical SAM protein [Deltaproteobacteria bacterium]